MKAMFKGSVVKKWIDHNNQVENIDYHEYNRLLVKSCVYFYHKCWKSRCVELQKDEKQQVVLKEEIKIMKQHGMIDKYKGLPRYVREHPTNEEVASAIEMKNWISGYRAFQRGAEKVKVNAIDDDRGINSQRKQV